jgi:hypothetical protein
MKTFGGDRRNEAGSVLVVSLLILVLLTIIGISAMNTSNVELKISGNEKVYKMALYAAESARAYVAKRSELYGSDFVTVGETLNFPDDDDPSARVQLGPKQSFNGSVEYLGFSVPLRGSGTQVGGFKMHTYKMTCKGYGPSNAESQVEAGFYRMGF